MIMLPAAETVGFIGRAGAARGRDFCYSCLVRSLAAPQYAGLPRAAVLAAPLPGSRASGTLAETL